MAMSDFDLTHLSIHPARELKRAYQELVLKFHPDKTGGKECEAFINVQVSDLETSMMDIITKRPKRVLHSCDVYGQSTLIGMIQEAWQVLGDVENRAR